MSTRWTFVRAVYTASSRNFPCEIHCILRLFCRSPIACIMPITTPTFQRPHTSALLGGRVLQRQNFCTRQTARLLNYIEGNIQRDQRACHIKHPTLSFKTPFKTPLFHFLLSSIYLLSLLYNFTSPLLLCRDIKANIEK